MGLYLLHDSVPIKSVKVRYLPAAVTDSVQPLTINNGGKVLTSVDRAGVLTCASDAVSVASSACTHHIQVCTKYTGWPKNSKPLAS